MDGFRNLELSYPRQYLAPRTRPLRQEKSIGVEVPHAQSDPSLAVHLQYFHLDDVALGEFIADLLHPLIGNLGDVHEPVLAGKNSYERAEVHQPDNFTLIDATNLNISSYQLDTRLRLSSRRAVDGGNTHRPVIIDVNSGTGFLGHGADNGSTLTDDVTNFLRIDF